MQPNTKTILYIALIVIATFLVVYAAVMLLAPASRDKLKKRKTRTGLRLVPDRLGPYTLGVGEGMSYDQSGQRFSYAAPGQDPVIKGHFDKNTESASGPGNDAGVFDMLMQ